MIYYNTKYERDLNKINLPLLFIILARQLSLCYSYKNAIQHSHVIPFWATRNEFHSVLFVKFSNEMICKIYVDYFFSKQLKFVLQDVDPSISFWRVCGDNALHWNGNVVILMKFSSLAASEVVSLTTYDAISDENFAKTITFPFQCMSCLHTSTPELYIAFLNTAWIIVPPYHFLKHSMTWCQIVCVAFPDSKVHGPNMGPTWVLSAPDGPHIGRMNLAIRVV